MKETLGVALTGKSMAMGIRLGGGQVVQQLSLSDGGDGFLEAFQQVTSAAPQRTICADALGRLVWAEFLFDAEHDEAFIEMARCSGIALIPAAQRDVIRSGTGGLGEMIARAIALGARRIHVGLGGSATCDGGLGMLMRLEEILVRRQPGNFHYSAADHARKLMPDFPALSEALRNVEFSVYSDVQNPLLGEMGTARLFAPQKGATPLQVNQLEFWMEQWAMMVEEAVGRRLRDVPGAGAAGGLGFAFAALGTQLRPGAQQFCEFIRLRERLAHCDGLITCEGRFDRSSLVGKAPWTAAKIARSMDRHAIICCGMADDEARAAAAEQGVRVIEFGRDLPPERRLAESFILLQQAVERFIATGRA